MNAPLNVSSTSGIQLGSIQSLDIEAVLLSVQNQRASILEGQLSTQLQDVQKKNEQIGHANNLLNATRSFSASLTEDQKKLEKLDPAEFTEEQATLYNAMTTAAGTAGIDASAENFKNSTGLDALLNNIKTNIDSLSNSQQMDMLRLQSLSNKRNEAFDLMTNFVKKMQDSRSSVISNMR